MSLENITTYELKKDVLPPIEDSYKSKTPYSGLQKLEEANFKGKTSIKYWM